MPTMNKVSSICPFIHFLSFLSRSCGERKEERVRRSVDKGVGGRREKERGKVHNDDELP